MEEDFLTYLKKLEETKPVIFCGVPNVAYTDRSEESKDESENAGLPMKSVKIHRAECRICRYIRYFYPEQTGIYSGWSYRFSARAKNAGWRIDYFCVSRV